jgi:hypothetical protein
MIGQSRFHRRCDSERLVYAAEVVVHGPPGHRLDHGLPEGRQKQRHPGPAEQGQPRGLSLTVAISKWTGGQGDERFLTHADFVDHRATFLVDLVQFTELREARKLRTEMLDNVMRAHHTPGVLTKVDLAPEARAIGDCLRTLHQKLKL